jgi:RNA polymerase sigma factor (sigma-70 family)
MTYLEDKELLAGCISGDGHAQEEFVKRFSDLVYKCVQYSLKVRNVFYNQDDVEDLHNTVFVKVLEKKCKKLRQFKGKNGCSLASWIRLITVRIVLDYLRKSNTDAITKKERTLSLDAMVSLKGETPEPWTLIDKMEQAQLIRQGLEELLPRDRLFLKLHFLEGLPIGEVAGILRISEGNAYSLKHRAIERLRKKIPQSTDQMMQ